MMLVGSESINYRAIRVPSRGSGARIPGGGSGGGVPSERRFLILQASSFFFVLSHSKFASRGALLPWSSNVLHYCQRESVSNAVVGAEIHPLGVLSDAIRKADQTVSAMREMRNPNIIID